MSEPRGQVFGEWDAPVTDDDEPIATPVGNMCLWCHESIRDGDNGRITPIWCHQGHRAGGDTEHRECSLRNVTGGIGHLVDHARYCRGELGPDAGLTRRESSRLVWEYFQQTHLAPSREQEMAWKLRLGALIPDPSLPAVDGQP